MSNHVSLFRHFLNLTNRNLAEQLTDEWYCNSALKRLHRVGIEIRAGDLGHAALVLRVVDDMRAELSSYFEDIRSEKLRTQKGRPQRYFDKLLAQVAAYKLKELELSTASERPSKEKIRIKAAVWLGSPATEITIRNALRDFSSVAPSDYLCHDQLNNLVETVGIELLKIAAAQDLDARTAAANQKSLRHAPVLVFSNGAP